MLTKIETSELARSVLAVPPFALTPDFEVSREGNAKLIRHLELSRGYAINFHLDGVPPTAPNEDFLTVDGALGSHPGDGAKVLRVWDHA